MCHSELSEALEHYRHGLPPDRIVNLGNGPLEERIGKPDGIPVELADVLIRIFHYCGANSIPLGEALRQKIEYNEKRPYRHGGKKI